MSVIKNMESISGLCVIMFYVLCILCIIVVRCDWFFRCMEGCKYCRLVRICRLFHVLFCVGVGCSVVTVVLYVICRFVCLNRFVIIRMVELRYVKVVLIFQECDVVVMLLDLFLLCGMC